MDNLPDREASIRKRLAHAQQPTAQEIGMTFAAITYASDIAFLLAQSAALRDQLARAEAVVQAARAVESQYRRLMGANEMLELLNLIRVPLRSALEAYDAALAARTPTPGAAGEVG